MKINLLYVSFILVILIFILSGFKGDDKTSLRKVNTNDDYKFIAINNILMWVSNNGSGSHDPFTDSNGFYWPGGGINEYMSAIFQDGLLFAAKVNNEIRSGGNTHRSGLQAGKVLNGIPDNPDADKYRVYKITRNWELLPAGSERDAREKDYNEWPISDGAPYEDVNGDGSPNPGVDKPKYIGDETLWFVSNDMDTTRSKDLLGSQPLGLEIQTTVYGYKKFNTLGDAVFKKYLLINKSSDEFKDMYVGFWSDPDLGDAGDDYVGCDTVLNLGYVYNGKSTDWSYGDRPPAVGYTLLQGPKVSGLPTDSALFRDSWIKGYKNLNMTSFINILKRQGELGSLWQGSYEGTLQLYNYFQGKTMTGKPIISPAGDTTVYMLAGDPVSGTGWYEGPGWPDGPYPGDRRMLVTSGSFNLAPGDSQEVVFAIHVAQGYDYLNSITELKTQSRLLKQLYDSRMDYITLPYAPEIYGVPQDNSATIWWENNSEDYSVEDPILPDTLKFSTGGKEFVIPVTDKSYKFEGYKIWQFRDITGNEPSLVAIVDIKNEVNKIFPYPLGFIDINLQDIPADPVIFSPDEGLKKYYEFTSDKFTGGPLLNGKEYYFGVSAYAYSEFSDPPVLESKPRIIEIIPGVKPAGTELTYESGSRINFEHAEGDSDGEVYAMVIDPFRLNGNQYEVTFSGSRDSLSYELKNVTSGNIVSAGNDFGTDSVHKQVTDGFILFVDNTKKYKIKAVEEIKGPGGVEISPRNVFSTSGSTNLNSTGEWTITTVTFSGQTPSPSDDLQSLDRSYSLEDYDYEIRFTESGSEYFSTNLPNFYTNQKGKGIVPFEVWRIPHDSSGILSRLEIVVFDVNQDSYWSKIDNTYETIYTRLSNGPPKIGNLVINGELPLSGTVVSIKTNNPFKAGDKYTAVLTAPAYSNELAKQEINKITVFPNPYIGTRAISADYPPYVRFTNLPPKVIIRIFSLAGVYITKIEKDGEGQYIDWNLRNKDNEPVAGGIYLAYLELPEVGTRVMKIAVIP